MSDTRFSLGDRYSVEDGEILLSGVQALVRLPIDQMRADLARGLKTAAFISGYQGSPLGGYDRELASQQALLDRFHIVHQPGVNEELAATSVMGSQLTALRPDRKFDGVAGYWYGKAPGLDRAGDAIRHANWAGTGRAGGAVALVGDDPACKSSTLPSRSDQALVALGLPVLSPGTVQDVLDLGRHALEMSRFAGLWVALKIITPIADGTEKAHVSPHRIGVVTPDDIVDGKPFVASLSGDVGPPRTATIEREMTEYRPELALRYVRANQLNLTFGALDRAEVGFVVPGHLFPNLLDGLAILGITRDQLEQRGIRILKLGALSPFDHDCVARLADGVRLVMVVEEKSPWLEHQVRSALYGRSSAPVVGSRDLDGNRLMATTAIPSPSQMATAMRRILAPLGVEVTPEAPPAPLGRITIGSSGPRTPYFCSGCPHNTSTQVPEGALVGAGIGCHGMVSFLDPSRRGEVLGLTQMGGEGAQWIGLAPFVDTDHIFQNLGDGTFFHSGQLAVQANVAAGTHMTYKLLYNAAVAMTGGQDAQGALSPAAVARKFMNEGVKKVIITTDEPAKYKGVRIGDGVEVWHRDRIVEAQEALRAIPGVTALIHDQQCAAEKRRDRKRGILPKPTFKIMIDERVCEGCGDCGVKSNCLSLTPVDTEFGRKTAVDQTSCNLDASCVKGDCPAFITVKPGTKQRSGSIFEVDACPEPASLPAHAVVRIPGIGGTGIVTVSQVLGTAAGIDGLPAHVSDQTGLSQKAGPVVSNITIGEPLPGGVDVVIASDVLVATQGANLDGVEPDRTALVASTSATPVGRSIGKPATANMDTGPQLALLTGLTRDGAHHAADVSAITTALFGDAITANVFLLGMAYQAGLLPVKATSIEEALTLNGVQVKANIAAFRYGRTWVHDPSSLPAAAKRAVALEPWEQGRYSDDVSTTVGIRIAELTAYQSPAYARRYADAMRKVADAELAAAPDAGFAFTLSVAQQLHKLMAYKDEYEVARLLLDGRSKVAAQFGDDAKATWNLHPPMLRSMGMKGKLRFAGWTAPAFSILRAGKRLRGTPLDVFGYAGIRKTERALIGEYIDLIDNTLGRLVDDYDRCVELARAADVIRGYEHVKLANIDRFRADVQRITTTKDQPAAVSA